MDYLSNPSAKKLIKVLNNWQTTIFWLMMICIGFLLNAETLELRIMIYT